MRLPGKEGDPLWKRVGLKTLSLLGFIAIAFMTAEVVGFHAGVFLLSGVVILTLAVSSVLSSIPREKFVSFFANTFGWLPVTVGALSYLFWYFYAESFDAPESDFFHASADVLPVLLLAAVIDVRRSETLESKGLILPIIAVFLGEVAALNALAFGYAGPGDFAAVSSSLVSTTVALVLAVLADVTEPHGEATKASGKIKTGENFSDAESSTQEPTQDNGQEEEKDERDT